MSSQELLTNRDGSAQAGSGTRGRVLIVSKPAIRTGIYAAALALQGFFTRSVGNADAAAHELAASHFDCVLADGRDPDADAVVRQLRFRCGPTPAVMLLRSFADGPLAPGTTDGETVALPEAAPLANVVSAVSALVDPSSRWDAAPAPADTSQQPRRKTWEERETVPEF